LRIEHVDSALERFSRRCDSRHEVGPTRIRSGGTIKLIALVISLGPDTFGGGSLEVLASTLPSG
jgi:hypothetical protein